MHSLSQYLVVQYKTLRAQAVLGSVLLFLSLCLPPAQAAADAPIGQVILLTGQQATVLRHNQSLPLTQQSAIYEGDTLVTGAHTYLHLKLADNARLSLRPNAQLTLSCYQTQAPHPCIKLTLQQGQMHLIDGETAQAHPQRFRLNTPIAAIGVKGTEFIVNTERQLTQVQVLEGTIVIAPLDSDCSPQTLGICNTPLAESLSQQDPFLLQVAPYQKPQKIPLTQQRLLRKTVQKHPLVPTVLTVAQILADDPQLVQQFIQQAQPQQQVEQEIKGNNTNIDKQPLIYSYWNNVSDDLNRPKSSIDEGYKATVGDSQTVLWRLEGGYTPPLGTLSYQLQQAQATLNQGGQRQPLEVGQGSLTLNFDTRHITTSLSVKNPGQWQQSYMLDQRISRDDGIFALTNPQGVKFTGAISNDGQQVGYYINQQRPEGLVKVQTFWQALPKQ